MRILIVLAVAIITFTLLPTAAHADVFVLYADSLVTATGSRFKVERPGCMDVDDIHGPYMQWTYPNSNWEFQYGECLTGWIFLGIISYWDIMGLGGWGRCCEQAILPQPSSGLVEAIDCEDQAVTATTLSGFIDVDSPCPCGTATGVPGDGVESTWGAIKALFATD